MDAAHAFEIAADVAGALGAVVLVAPAYRLVVLQRMLDDRSASAQAARQSVTTTGPTRVQGRVEHAREALAHFDPFDLKAILIGVGLVASSFVLKLICHAIRLSA